MLLTTELLVLMTVAVFGVALGLQSVADQTNAELQDLAFAKQGMVQRAVYTHRVNVVVVREQRARGLTARLPLPQVYLLALPGSDAIRAEWATDGPPVQLEGLPCN
jgi:hypothetical protein